MVLPTDATVLATCTPADHAAWHEEMRGLLTFLDLKPLTTSSLGHREVHKSLNLLVGSGLTDDPQEEEPAHLPSHHQIIHQWMNTHTITNLTTSSNIQSAMTAGAIGTVFGLPQGIYYPGTHLPNSGGIVPKQNQELFGAPGAVLNGSVALTSWTVSGSDFYATRASGTLAEQSALYAERCAITGCTNRNDIFYDGSPLTRVMSQAALAPGKFWEDFTNNRVYIRDNPTNHDVRQAVADHAWKPVASGTKIRNLVVEMFSNPSQQGAVELNGDTGIAENLDVRLNHGLGLRTNASDTVLRKSKVHHQQQMGLGSEGFFVNAGWGEDILIEDVEVYRNNRDASYLEGFEAGGAKWAYTSRMIVRRMWSHHNGGIGIWFDIRNGNATIEDCYSDHNNSVGIFYEISYGEVVDGDGLFTHIRRNVCDRNKDLEDTQGFWDAGQIVSASSRDVKIYENITRGKDGIGIIAQDRPDSTDARGDHTVNNVTVYDNDIEITFIYPTTGDDSWANAAGLKCDHAAQEPMVYDSRGNGFSGNRYYVPNHPGNANYPHWTWKGSTGTDFATFAQWQAFGQDTNASGGSRTVGGTIPNFPNPPDLKAGPRGHLRYGATEILGESLEPATTTGTQATTGTIAAVLAAASPGDTILLRAGTYAGFTIPAGTSGNPITVKPYNGEAVIINSQFTMNSYTRLAGVKAESSAAQWLTRIGSTTATAIQDVEIRNCTIRGGTTEAIRIRQNAQNIRIVGCDIEGGQTNHVVKWHWESITTWSPSGSMSNCRLRKRNIASGGIYNYVTTEDLLQVEGHGIVTADHITFGAMQATTSAEDGLDVKSPNSGTGGRFTLTYSLFEGPFGAEAGILQALSDDTIVRDCKVVGDSLSIGASSQNVSALVERVWFTGGASFVVRRSGYTGRMPARIRDVFMEGGTFQLGTTTGGDQPNLAELTGLRLVGTNIVINAGSTYTCKEGRFSGTTGASLTCT